MLWVGCICIQVGRCVITSEALGQPTTAAGATHSGGAVVYRGAWDGVACAVKNLRKPFYKRAKAGLAGVLELWQEVDQSSGVGCALDWPR